jgi:O-antigen ligase
LVQKKALFRFTLVVLSGAILCVGFILIYQDVWNLNSVYDRIYFWKVAWQMWLDHPVFGVGISSFQDAYREMAASGLVPEFIAPDGSTFSASEQTHAHNLVLMLISCTGLLGLGAFTWLFIAANYLVFRNTGEFRYGLISWPAVLLVIGITGFNIYHSWYQALLAFWLILIGVEDSAIKAKLDAGPLGL